MSSAVIGDFQSAQILEQSSDLILCMPGKIYDCTYETRCDIVVPVPSEGKLYLTSIVLQITVAQLDRDRIR